MAVVNATGQTVNIYLAPKDWPDLKQSLQPGQRLTGRVVELFPDNKMLLNIKGFNVVAESPNLTFQKGDILNAQVTSLGDKAILRVLLPESAAAGMIEQSTSPDIMGIVGSLKVPLNEQSLTIARQLINNNIPVTKDNILEVLNGVRGLSQNTASAGSNGFSTISQLVNNFDEIQNKLSELEARLQTMPNSSPMLTSLSALKNNLRQQMNFISQIQDEADGNQQSIILENNSGENILAQLQGVPLTDGGGDNFANYISGFEKFSENYAAFTAGGQDLNPLSLSNSILDLQKAALDVFKQDRIVAQNPGFLNSVGLFLAGQRQFINAQIQNWQNQLASWQAGLTSQSGKSLNGLLQDLSRNIGANYPTSQIQNQAFQGLFLRMSKVATTSEEESAIQTLGKDFQEVSAQQIGNITKGFEQVFGSVPFKQMEQMASGSSDGALKNMVGLLKDQASLLKDGVFMSSSLDEADLTAARDILLQTAGDDAGKRLEVNNFFIGLSNLEDKVSSWNNHSGLETLSNIALDPKQANLLQRVMGRVSSPEGSVWEKKAAAEVQDTLSRSSGPFSRGGITLNQAVEIAVFLKAHSLPINGESLKIAKYFLTTNPALSQEIESMKAEIASLRNSGALPKSLETEIGNFMQTYAEVSLKLNQERISSQLESYVENGGIQLESKLRSALGDPTLQNTIQNDLKGILGKISHSLNSSTDPQNETYKNLQQKVESVLQTITGQQMMNNLSPQIPTRTIYLQLPFWLNQGMQHGEVMIQYRNKKKLALKGPDPVNLLFTLQTSRLGEVKIKAQLQNDRANIKINFANETLARWASQFEHELKSSMGQFELNLDPVQWGSADREDRVEEPPEQPYPGKINIKV